MIFIFMLTAFISTFAAEVGCPECLTTDPQPAHPGEAGKKTLLGIDSDNDGVRDDVEIWINENFKNTEKRNLFDNRLILKFNAKKMQLIIANHLNKDAVLKAIKEVIDMSACHIDISLSIDESLKNSDAFQGQFLNTEARFVAFTKAQSAADGLKVGRRNLTNLECVDKLKEMKNSVSTFKR